jgi:hypothetical protein
MTKSGRNRFISQDRPAAHTQLDRQHRVLGLRRRLGTHAAHAGLKLDGIGEMVLARQVQRARVERVAERAVLHALVLDERHLLFVPHLVIGLQVHHKALLVKRKAPQVEHAAQTQRRREPSARISARVAVATIGVGTRADALLKDANERPPEAAHDAPIAVVAVVKRAPHVDLLLLQAILEAQPGCKYLHLVTVMLPQRWAAEH